MFYLLVVLSIASSVYSQTAEEARDRIETAAWMYANSADIVRGYEDFLEKHPNCKHATDAVSRIEHILWQTADRENSLHSYEIYLQRYQDGMHSQEANLRISRLRENLKTCKSIPTDQLRALYTELLKFLHGRRSSVICTNKLRAHLYGFSAEGLVIDEIYFVQRRDGSIWKAYYGIPRGQIFATIRDGVILPGIEKAEVGLSVLEGSTVSLSGGQSWVFKDGGWYSCDGKRGIETDRGLTNSTNEEDDEEFNNEIVLEMLRDKLTYASGGRATVRELGLMKGNTIKFAVGAENELLVEYVIRDKELWKILLGTTQAVPEVAACR